MDSPAQREIYERCADLPGRAGDVRLRPYEWHFLMALDGRKTAAEVAAEVRVDETRLPEVIQRLRESKLMEVPELTWPEFAARYPAASAVALPVPPPAPTPPPPVLPASETPAPAEISNGEARVKTPAAAVTFAITRSSPAASRAVTPSPAPVEPAAPTPISVAVEMTPEPVVASPEPSLNLKQLLDYVTNHAGGGLRGKLAVYRLFLRVPNEQIRAAGIESLNFVDDRFEIRDPAMREAILDAVLAVTGRPYPRPAARD